MTSFTQEDLDITSSSHLNGKLKAIVTSIKKLSFVENIKDEVLDNLFKKKERHATMITHFCIDTLHQMGYEINMQGKGTGLKSKGYGEEEKLCNGSAYLLIRIIAYLAKD